MNAKIAIERHPKANLSRFISSMRAAAPFGEICWDESMWNLTSTLTRSGNRRHINTRAVLWFIEHREERNREAVPFAAPFDDFAKAVICARHVRGSQTVQTHRVSIRALRYLYDALALERKSDPSTLERRHFQKAESAVRMAEKISSAYRVGQRLEEIASMVDQYSISHAPLRFTSSIAKSSVEAISTKMPDVDALVALGTISGSKTIYEHTDDLIRMRVVDLHVATGFRSGEVLTLPLCPIVESGGDLFLRYWPEKGGVSRKKQISSVHRELVERAVADLTEVCAEARAVAKWNETNPGRAKLPTDFGETLYGADIVRLGLSKSSGSGAWLVSHGVPTRRTRGMITFQRDDLEKALVAMRDDRPMLVTGAGKTQSLGDSLIVVFHNQLHHAKSTNNFVPTALSWENIADFLGGRTQHGQESVFSRFSEQGETNVHRITSHQFRHWLHTVGKRGGLTEVELARWMGRRRIADNRAYDHRTHAERVEEARDLIRKGRVTGAVADAYKKLPPADQETFLGAHVNAVLSTPFGMCTHDYGQGPCERHFACAGCGELLRRKGDPGERAALTTMLERTQTNLEASRAEVLDGTFGASNWVTRNERLVIDLITMLDVDEHHGVADGDLVAVWPGSKRKGENVSA